MSDISDNESTAFDEELSSDDEVNETSRQEDKFKMCLEQFKKEDILTLTSMYNPTFKENLRGLNSKKLTKIELIQKLIDIVHNLGLDFHDVTVSVNLMGLATGLKRINWHSFKIQGIDNSDSIKHPEEFKTSLLNILKLQNVNIELDSKLLKEGIWNILNLEPKILARNSESKYLTYICYFPGSPFVFLGGPTYQKYERFVLRALTVMLNGTEVEDMALSGRSIPSLFQLALQRESKRKLNLPLDWPEIIRENQKKIRSPRKVLFLNDLSRREKFERKQYVEKYFGDYVQPQLEIVSIKTETKWMGFEDPKKNEVFDKPVKTGVKFMGTNVIEGIRQLVLNGIMDIPLNSVVRDLPILGCNDLSAKMKQ